MAAKMNWWEYLIPFWPLMKNGYYTAKAIGESIDNKNNGVSNFDADHTTDSYNAHNVSSTPDVNGYQQVEVTPADPTSSASNVINYDPNKSAQENLLGYAQANNSASAYESYLANQYQTEMSNTALSRAIADAESQGISKYQLFQSGNMAASSPSSAVGTSTSYENSMNRRENWNEKELQIVTSMISSMVSSAFGLIGKIAS